MILFFFLKEAVGGMACLFVAAQGGGVVVEILFLSSDE